MFPMSGVKNSNYHLQFCILKLLDTQGQEHREHHPGPLILLYNAVPITKAQHHYQLSYISTLCFHSQASLLSNDDRAMPKACTADRGHW